MATTELYSTCFKRRKGGMMATARVVFWNKLNVFFFKTKTIKWAL